MKRGWVRNYLYKRDAIQKFEKYFLILIMISLKFSSFCTRCWAFLSIHPTPLIACSVLSTIPHCTLQVYFYLLFALKGEIDYSNFIIYSGQIFFQNFMSCLLLLVWLANHHAWVCISSPLHIIKEFVLRYNSLYIYSLITS